MYDFFPCLFLLEREIIQFNWSWFTPEEGRMSKYREFEHNVAILFYPNGLMQYADYVN